MKMVIVLVIGLMVISACDGSNTKESLATTTTLKPTATLMPTATLKPKITTSSTQSILRYDPFGPDRDCGDFLTQKEAQAFFKAAGGPFSDPHRLDGDDDGIACELLP
tara:strand:- start:114 stop:437 length:324 start_codon:yes stop_codon:yes gene_type:complete